MNCAAANRRNIALKSKPRSSGWLDAGFGSTHFASLAGLRQPKNDRRREGMALPKVCPTVLRQIHISPAQRDTLQLQPGFVDEVAVSYGLVAVVGIDAPEFLESCLAIAAVLSSANDRGWRACWRAESLAFPAGTKAGASPDLAG